MLGSCSRNLPPASPGTASAGTPAPENAVAAGVAAGPPLQGLLTPQAAAQALPAFRASCPALLKRSDESGLTRPEEWAPVCAAAQDAGDAGAFFATWFSPVRVGDGSAFATGYYVPRIAASRAQRPGYEVPIYKVPDDLVEADLGLFSPSLKGKRIRGRVSDRRLVPYYERGEIDDGALAGRGLEIAWAADPVDLFFLQIQGSGELALTDGTIVQIGYAGQNGRDYLAIGKLMRDRGLLAPGHTTMQDITAWLRAHPDDARALMRENKSYIFFTVRDGPGPLGAMGLPLTSAISAAADPRFIPAGAPVILATDRPEANRLWIAQDTGGAIKGANRLDTFWGAGEDAARIAGGMAARGRALILLPKSSLARLAADQNGAQAQR